MDIQINFTIVLQIINFLFSYFLLRNFFLRPAVDVLNRKESEKNSLEAQTSSLDKNISERESAILQLWKSARVKFDEYISHCSIYVTKHIKINSISEIPKDKKEESGLVDLISNKLVKEFQNVTSR